MVEDRSDWNAEIRDLKRRIARLESGSMLESSSIDRGGMTVRAAEGIRVEAPGTIMVGGDEPVTLGQVGSQAQIGVGDEVVIYAADGYFNISFQGQNVVRVGPGGTNLVGPEATGVSAESESITLSIDGTVALMLRDGGSNRYMLLNRALIPELPSSLTGEHLVIASDNRMYRTTGGSGGGPGPGGSRFRWPFSLDLVTSEFRPPDRPTHDGIDFGLGIANIEGTPIPCMGAGTVSRILAEGQGHGWGNGVVVDHGTVEGSNLRTLYAHMYQPPPVSLGQQVTKGQTLGGIGNTGNSFGNHLHLETHVNGTPINPRTFMATYENA